MPPDPPEQACITAGPLLLCSCYLITSLGLALEVISLPLIIGLEIGQFSCL